MRAFAGVFLSACLLASCSAAAQVDHRQHGAGSQAPSEPGQAAFAAISEIVAILRADPATDWSKVSIDSLRNHLVDMDNVLMRSSVSTTPIPGGARFEVSGEPMVADSIRRMVTAHAAMAEGQDGFHLVVASTPTGATLTVIGQPADEARIRALGFFGLLALGTHHQPHHRMMAQGAMMH